MEVEILTAAGSKSLGRVKVDTNTTVGELKDLIKKNLRKNLDANRQAIKLDLKGKTLKDEDKLSVLNVTNGGKLYLKDLGPQISWKGVFLAEYAGPLLAYAWAYQRPWILYGDHSGPISTVTTVAAICWCTHYAKRLLETLFVHRFSHGTMPLSNLFKNCSYYWLFALYVAYHVNHPLYTPPNTLVFVAGLLGFVVCELGNLGVHLALRNLRPPGTKVRKIPMPDGNPLTGLFNFVSCPNYTYEFGAWFSFTIMTSCLPAGIFAAAGFYQMAVWAAGKHRNYKKEFSNYPKGRKAIVPFLI